jgi:hypothetical protein
LPEQFPLSRLVGFQQHCFQALHPHPPVLALLLQARSYSLLCSLLYSAAAETFSAVLTLLMEFCTRMKGIE